jgi:hypothetical protein
MLLEIRSHPAALSSGNAAQHGSRSLHAFGGKHSTIHEVLVQSKRSLALGF